MGPAGVAPANALPAGAAASSEVKPVPAGTSAAAGGASEVAAILVAARLDAYAARMEEAGFDDLYFLRELAKQQEEFKASMVDHVGMKPGHAMRLNWMLTQ